MARYTPDTGYPQAPITEKAFNDDDVLVFSDGSSRTGKEQNEIMENYLNSTRGRALLAYVAGEGPRPMPTPLMSVLREASSGETRAYLEDTNVDITDIDPVAAALRDSLSTNSSD